MSEENLKTLEKIMSFQYEDIKRRLNEQNSKMDNQGVELKRQTEKSDEYFDERISRIEDYIRSELKEMNSSIANKNVDMALLKKETESIAKSWSATVSTVTAAITSILIGFVSKFFGL